MIFFCFHFGGESFSNRFQFSDVFFFLFVCFCFVLFCLLFLFFLERRNIYVYANLTALYEPKTEESEGGEEGRREERGEASAATPNLRCDGGGQEGDDETALIATEQQKVTKMERASRGREETEGERQRQGQGEWDEEKGPRASESQVGATDGVSREGAAVGEEKGPKEGREREKSWRSTLRERVEKAEERVEEKFEEIVSAEIEKPKGSSDCSSKLSDRAFRYPLLLRVSVRDEGIGIDPKDHKRVFRMFEQLHTNESQKIPGTGLGLGISQKLCELMGGGIAVKSAVGHGSTFTATMVLQWAEKKQEELAPVITSVREQQVEM